MPASLFWTLVVAGIAAAIAIIATAIVLGVRALRRRRLAQAVEARQEEDAVKYAFIVNPSKPHASEIAFKIRAYCSEHDIKRPLFIETQLDKDGRDCAREALAAGADVVIAVGGDGTVRTAASAMAGSGHAFGIIPIGTGNLFARNMGIPVDNLELALQVATSHGSRQVDMGRMRLLDSDEPDRGHAFLIVAGVGFDALMIDDTDPELKKNISWLAYFVGGVKNLFAPKAHGDVTITGADGREQRSTNVSFRTFMAGNCGQIPGFSLMPEALYDDGIIDFEMIDTTGGLIGWANLFGDVVHQTITGKAQQSPFSTNSTIDQIQGVRALLELDDEVLAQTDGDVLGMTRRVELSVERRSLIVRVPESTVSSLGLAAAGTTAGEVTDAETTAQMAAIVLDEYGRGDTTAGAGPAEESGTGGYGRETGAELKRELHESRAA